MHRLLATAILIAAAVSAWNADASERRSVQSAEEVQAVLQGPINPRNTQQIDWIRSVAEKERDGVQPPSQLAIIAWRVQPAEPNATSLAPEPIGPDWHLPVECMRVIETVTDGAAMSYLWLRQSTPNLAEYETCAEVAMNYAPIWEAAHRNWIIVKVGCPTKIVDADGRTVGWHMPECQGTLPGTTHPLRCRFDPSEI